MIDDDDRADYPSSATIRCPRCKHRFKVMADERDMHACPSCGYDGKDSGEDDDEEPPCAVCGGSGELQCFEDTCACDGGHPCDGCS